MSAEERSCRVHSDRKMLVIKNTEALHELDHWLRNPGPEDHDRAAAVTYYFRRYDLLAFPGGLTNGLQRLSASDLEAIETAITFLEVDPMFHRSGYIKQNLLRQLKRISLTEQQRCRLKDIVLTKISAGDSREFRAYARLAGYIADEDFCAAIENLKHFNDLSISRRASWVLHAIKQVQKSTTHSKTKRLELRQSS